MYVYMWGVLQEHDNFIACEGDRVPLTDPDSQLNRQRLLSVFADATLVFIFSARSD